MALQNYVSERRLEYFKTKLDAIFATFKVKNVKVNGTELTPDANGAVDVVAATVKQTNDSQGREWSSTEISQGDEGAVISFTDRTEGVYMYVSDRERNEVENGKTLVDLSYANSIVGKIDVIRVNNTQLPITNKTVNIEVIDLDWEEDRTKIMSAGGLTTGMAFIDVTDGVEIMFAKGSKTSRSFVYKTLAEKSYVDNNFRTQQQVQDAIDAALEDVSGVDFQVVADVSSLPVTGEKGVFYLVPNAGAGQNVYDEYVWLNSGTAESPNYHYEKIGSTAIDLTGYVQESDLVEITEAEIDAMFA